MERTPKQRIIFDEDMYDDEFLRDYLAEDYEIYKDELDVSFDEYVEHRRNEGALYDIKERDFTEEMASLRSFLDNGNPLIVSGSIGRWDGTRTGFTVYDNFDAAIDTSPSRFGGDNVFADCAWTVGREDLQAIYRHLCDIRENFPGTPSERKVNLKDEAVSSRNASQALANGIGYDDRVQDAR